MYEETVSMNVSAYVFAAGGSVMVPRYKWA